MWISLDYIVNFAKEGHESINQVRKYNGEPYFNHCHRVMYILQHFGVRDEEILAAAANHDIVEDIFPINNYYSPSNIARYSTERVKNLVLEVTNYYTKERFPWINRRKRNNLETCRLWQISADAQKIKCADIIDNCTDIQRNDPDFAKIYCQEKHDVLRGFRIKDLPIYKSACKVVGF